MIAGDYTYKVGAGRPGNASAKQDEAKQTARARTEEIIKAAGLSLLDVFPELAKSTAKGGSGSVPIKFRGPNGETWTGRGHTPKWITIHEAEDRKRDLFLIETDGATKWEREHKEQAVD